MTLMDLCNMAARRFQAQWWRVNPAWRALDKTAKDTLRKIRKLHAKLAFLHPETHARLIYQLA
jgi:hypothetical protein